MEFMVKRGVAVSAPPEILLKVLKNIEALKANDYKVKLGSLLEAGERKYYLSENFKILKSEILKRIG